jgi:hypothetical protein
MSKAKKVMAGHYEYKGFTIERREDREWYTGPIGEWAQDVTDTLAEAIAIVDLVTAADEE